MKLEYLFLSSENKDVLSKYTYTPTTGSKKDRNIKANVSSISFEGTDKWALHIEIKGKNETVARHLSAINDEIQGFNPTVLLNESSAYFNKLIFPLANEFERKLRKLIYVKSTLYNETKDDNKKISMEVLEKKDLGQIYEFLFADKDMIKTLRSKFGERNSSKQYYQKILSEIPENSIWNILMGNKKKDYIKEQFIDIIDFRNDTMHAHNISYSMFRKQRNTFKRALKIIDIEIAKVIKEPIPIEILERLNAALASNSKLPPNQKLYRIQQMLLFLASQNYVVEDEAFLDAILEDEDVKKYIKKNMGIEYEQYTL